MYNNESFHNMRTVVVFQHFIGIKRTYLLDDSTTIFFSNIILVFAPSILVGSIIYDIFYLNSVNYSIVIFEVFVSLEAVYLLCAAAFQTKTFDAINNLDEKCLFSEKYASNIEAKSLTMIIISALSVTLDAFGIWRLDAPTSAIIILTMSFAVHDTEIGFYYVIISGINLRLFSIVGSNINHGSKVYRHVLLIASHFEKEFNLPILIMLGTTFVTTVVYSLVIFLVDSSMRANIGMFIIWRELKSLYSLWLLCSAAAETKLACSEIIGYLSKSLIFDFKRREKSSLQRATKRLLLCVQTEKPRYVNGSIFSIDLGVPLRIVDISVNYLLIILQIYVAYVMKH